MQLGGIEEQDNDAGRGWARGEGGLNRNGVGVGLISYLVHGNMVAVHYVTVNSAFRVRRARVER